MSTAQKISALINSQLPDFVRSDHPNFVAFLEAYYEYLEQSNNVISQGKTVERAKNMLNYLDIDTTIDAFATKFYNEFLSLIPKDTAANKTQIIKGIKDFYRARGTEKSFKFLFRALYNREPDFYYPKNDILIASSGKWFIEKSIRITTITINNVVGNTLTNLEMFIGTRIKGATSGAQADVERVLISYEAGEQIYELFVSNQNGTFINGENISTIDIDSNDLKATILSGRINTITIKTGGAGYAIGDPLVFEGGGGSGAAAIVSSVSTGNISSVLIVSGGSGFRTSDQIIFTGGGGSGAAAYVSAVVANGYFHANTYNLNSDIINTYASTVIGAYSNGAGGNANTSMANTLTFFVYGNTGPMSVITVSNPGNNYISVPSADVVGNTRIKNLGVLGKLNINNGGLNYSVGDQLIFKNPIGAYGLAANANVVSVAANGAITRVQYQTVPGFLPGGMGYDPLNLPSVTVQSSTGAGANITVDGLLGYGAPFSNLYVTTSTVGVVQSITILNRGSNYSNAPNINLASTGDGTAQAVAAIATGVFSYPGRYLDDTGFPSGYNFLQDKDYYQNYSYVIRVKESIDNYRDQVKKILNPAGMKLWGEYRFINDHPETNTIIQTANGVNTQFPIYTANAVSFANNNTFLYANTTPGNANLSSQGTFSVWINIKSSPASNTDEQFIYYAGNTNTSPRFTVSLANTANSHTRGNYIKIKGLDQTGAVVLDIRSNVSPQLTQNNWVHILSSWDLTNTSKRHVYLTNVATMNVVTYTANANVSHNVAFISVGARHSGNNHFDGNIAELWYDDTYIDFSNVANREKFISNTLHPVSLGTTGSTPTGSVPIQYLRYANVAFANSASNPSNNLKIAGTITVAAESPGDI